jgi:glutathione S-transferase
MHEGAHYPRCRRGVKRRFEIVEVWSRGSEKSSDAGAQPRRGPFTAADAYLFTVLNWGQWTDVDLAKWPVLKDYVTRIAARPQVRDALKVEGLLKIAKAA